eukprot:CAMPEP_0168335676 /NCGR_PEP_ID=MMETSP0213-20121227/11060_1 /TAXON_ID=151035 /ORGANISM="Euplotes harpa, Strain FSP1.4" /LENGTH=130 /DNA_ID=CAMNT_0008340667 /DNA_START=134 /DNA_END=527 /DNA_ORIENTATION=+
MTREPVLLMHREILAMEFNSSLSQDVIPDPELLEQLESYFPRFSPEIVRMIASKSGMSTEDNKVYNVLAIAVEIFMNKLLNEIYDVDNRNKKNLKTHLVYDELALVLKDFNIDANCIQKFTEKREAAGEQ